MLHVVCGFILSSMELFYVLFFGFHNPYINVVCGFISSIELFYVFFLWFSQPVYKPLYPVAVLLGVVDCILLISVCVVVCVMFACLHINKNKTK